MSTQSFSDAICDWIKELGFTTCFFVPGGNMMPLLNSARTKFECIPVLHEVSAVIASEYFNELSNSNERSFVLVTAGPGITNCITGIAGAWLENRSVIVIGGQAKTSDLSHGRVRQIGHQEIDGIALTKSITKTARRIESPISKVEFQELVASSWSFKPGPVFLEICLDTSQKEVELDNSICEPAILMPRNIDSPEAELIESELRKSQRPLLLIGGGLSRAASSMYLERLKLLSVPIATTFNGADRIDYAYKYYCGRPNWYGMRWANTLIQQADLIIALGTRLGIQQVGFNWTEFAPNGKLIHIDGDKSELQKIFPRRHQALDVDAESVLAELCPALEKKGLQIENWLRHIEVVRELLDNPEPQFNQTKGEYIELQSFLYSLSDLTQEGDLIIPCSSGGTFTGMMQMYRQKTNQKIVTNKSLASMGYGLAGAIGASFSSMAKRVFLVEGDGGFSQNLQELGVVRAHNLNIKIFIMNNEGYGTIKNSQRRSFNGNFLGCNAETGLWLPNWVEIAKSFGLPHFLLSKINFNPENVTNLLAHTGPQIIEVQLDPDQDYFPKLLSMKDNDNMVVSMPLHEMHPKLADDLWAKVYKWK